MDQHQFTFSVGPSSSKPVPNKPLTLDDFKGMGAEPKLRADGKPPKRRGPKPDSKPAQTRRQELNRQAQRTHRDRKETYVKLLEEEVEDSRTRYKQISQDLRESRTEVDRLTQLLLSHGISFLGPDYGNNSLPPQSLESLPRSSASHHSFNNAASTPQFSAGAPSFVSPPADTPHHDFQLSPDLSRHPDPLSPVHQHFTQQLERVPRIVPEFLMANDIDYTQFAKDFIRSLEMPCTDHAQMLCHRVLHNPNALPTGHALMATYPPREAVAAYPEVQYPHQLPNLPDRDLIQLFGLTHTVPDRIVQSGEVSPIEAWRILWGCEELCLLSLEDLVGIQEYLLPRVRCYGYGAVVESFEVRDAIQGRVRMRELAQQQAAAQFLLSGGDISQDHYMVDQQMTGQFI